MSEFSVNICAYCIYLYYVCIVYICIYLIYIGEEVGFEPNPAQFTIYPWLCALESFLEVLREQYVVPVIKPVLTVFKGNQLNPKLYLQPYILNKFCSLNFFLVIFF